MDNPINKTDPDGRGVNDNNLIPEVTATAPAPQNNRDNDNVIATWYQELLNQANSNPQNTKPSQSGSNSSTTRPISPTLPTVDSKAKTNILDKISLAINAVGLSNDGIKIFTTNNAGKEIVYVTVQGANAALDIEKLKVAFKEIGGETIVLGIALDLMHTAVDRSYAAKAVANTSVALVACCVIGGPVGWTIEGTYLVLDQTGAFNREYHSGIGEREVCPADATRVVNH